MILEYHDVSLRSGCVATAGMGRKSAQVRPSQESLLQKRRFGEILVIAQREFPVSTDIQPALTGGLFIFGLLTP
jgi:hypothetical protein